MKKGDVIVVKETASSILGGKRAVILRVSKRTAGLTIELLEDARPYSKGSEVNVQQYEVRPAMEAR